jgi:hypothetical protein
MALGSISTFTLDIKTKVAVGLLKNFTEKIDGSYSQPEGLLTILQLFILEDFDKLLSIPHTI